VKTAVTVLVDSREKKPLPFPAHVVVGKKGGKGTTTIAVRTVVSKLNTGDYVLSGHETGTIIERKGSLMEVCQNVRRGDRKRFLAALDRVAEEAARPVLFLEGTPADLARAEHRDPTLRGGLDELMRLCLERDVHFLLLPARTPGNRRAAGEFLLRMLIAGATHAD
jgi:ERCC4-type nuclease